MKTCPFCGHDYIHIDMATRTCRCRKCLESWRFDQNGDRIEDKKGQSDANHA